MHSEASDVVSAYFSRMRAQDSSVVDLFARDARLIGLGTERRGLDAIGDFYRGVIERAGPMPRAAGPLFCEGARVAAEIYIELSDDQTLHAMDLFVVRDGLIESLTYFLCASGKDDSTESK